MKAGSAVSLLVLLLGVPSVAVGQTAERLYEAGAFRGAADSFAARTRTDPLVAAYWFNLGSSLYRTGEVTAARAAWVRAARLDPREPAMDAVLRLVPAPDPLTRALVPVEPFTPAEAWMVSAVLWLAGWLVVAWGKRRRLAAVPLVLALVMGGWALRTTQRYHRTVALVRRANTPLRSAPYTSAASRRTVNEGFAVLVTRSRGAWILVERGEETGWLLASEVVGL
ncbi:MAG: tetratricopeptide repeat protein [Gemmatimonadetes bacterium]|nr:tetratricopeptide repeat protein [Gemmatimonadota bacterium]